MVELTQQQRTAISTLDKNLCVRAGAGTGKTSVLVERYLHLLRSHTADMENIIAITFTEKAAAEMKERIRQACREEIENAQDDAAHAYWQNIQRRIESAKICTIHSLCTSILRENAVEARIDPDFRVLDEAESNILYRDVARDTLFDLLSAGDDKAVVLVRDFGVREVLRWMEKLYSRQELLQQVRYRRADREGMIRLWRKACLQEIMRELMEAVDKLKSFLDEGRLEKIKEQIKALADSTWEKLPEAIRNVAKAAHLKSLELKEVGEDVKKALEKFRNKANDIAKMKMIEKDVDEKAADIVEKCIDLFDAIMERFRELKRERGVLDFADLLILTRDLLLTGMSVRRRYHQRIKYILVDEFQDTDKLQQEIIYLLAEERARARQVSEVELAQGKLFVVGDPLQSIYGFRGAEVDVFIEVADSFRKWDGVLNLDKSFRMHEGLAWFINTVFKKICDKDMGFSYMPLVCGRQDKQVKPCVEIYLVEEVELPAEDKRRIEAKVIASRIKELVSEGLYRADGTQIPIRYRDIAILLRSLNDAPIYQEALEEQGISYHISGGKTFYGQQEIWDVMNMLSYIENPRDGVALVGVLRAPFFNVSDEALIALCKNYDICDWFNSDAEVPSFISEHASAKLVRARNVLKRLRAIKDRMSIAELMEEIVFATGYSAVLAGTLTADQRLANISKLMEAADWADEHGLLLSDFISSLQQLVVGEATEGEAPLFEESGDVVHILTVHKAKGLEFPVVIIADMGRKINVRTDNILVDRELGIGVKVLDENFERIESSAYYAIKKRSARKEINELKRLLYVAATRARELLVLSGFCEGWMKWLLEALPSEDTENNVKVTKIKGWFMPQKDSLPQKFIHKHMEKIRQLETIDGEEKKFEHFYNKRIMPLEAWAEWNRFTVTQVDDYIQCPYRFKLIHIDGYVHPSELNAVLYGKIHSTLRGTLVHKVLKLIGDKELEALIKKVLIEEGVADRGFEEELKAIINQFLRSPLWEDILRAEKVLSEWGFAIRFEDAILEGVVDKVLLDKEAKIIDFKTGEKGELDRYELQLGIYCLGVEKVLGAKVREGVVHFIEVGESHKLPFTPQVKGKVEENIRKAIKGIREGDFHREHLYCNSCPLRQICYQQN